MSQQDAQERKAALIQEMEAIHHANSLYWKQPEQERTTAAKAEYQRRLVRLAEIREELSRLQSAE